MTGAWRRTTLPARDRSAQLPILAARPTWVDDLLLAASMKLQAAGMIDPHRDACATTGAWSARPSTHGITCTGTW